MAHMHSSAMHFLGSLTWFITAFAAIHEGLRNFGYDLLTNPNVVAWAPAIRYVFGIAGLISLIFLVMHLSRAHTDSCCS